MRTKATPPLAGPANLMPTRGVLVISGYGLSVRVWRGRLRVADGVGRRRRKQSFTGRRWTPTARRAGPQRNGPPRGASAGWQTSALATSRSMPTGRCSRHSAHKGPTDPDCGGRRRPPWTRSSATRSPAGWWRKRSLRRPRHSSRSSEWRRSLTSPFGRSESRLTRSTSPSGGTRSGGPRPPRRRAYWSAWSEIPIRFARRDPGAVPGHWRTVGGRGSALTGSPRLATNPANALLNYLYALLEGEAAIAARIVGLDPGLGILHADLDSRDSLAADLMEPIRPLVDRFVLDLLADRYFATADFHETRQGACRITPTLARDLAATAPVWARAVGRIAEDVARLLTDPARPAPPTPITGRRRAAAGKYGPRPRQVVSTISTVPRRCTSCGEPTNGPRQTCSDGCAADAAVDNAQQFAAAGALRLAELRDAGFHRDLGLAARRRIGTRASELLRAARLWQRTHPWPSDMNEFGRDVLPKLARVPAPAIAAATGLSLGYCRRVKAGDVTPHPMWWERLSQITGN